LKRKTPAYVSNLINYILLHIIHYHTLYFYKTSNGGEREICTTSTTTQNRIFNRRRGTTGKVKRCQVRDQRDRTIGE
jgi:hypothetical protein